MQVTPAKASAGIDASVGLFVSHELSQACPLASLHAAAAAATIAAAATAKNMALLHMWTVATQRGGARAAQRVSHPALDQTSTHTGVHDTDGDGHCDETAVHRATGWVETACVVAM